MELSPVGDSITGNPPGAMTAYETLEIAVSLILFEQPDNLSRR